LPYPSPAHTARCHTLHTPLLHILPAVIPSTHLSCTYCPLSYSPHPSPTHTACCHTLHRPLLHILPIVIPSTHLSCTYCPLSYPPHTLFCTYCHCHTLLAAGSTPAHTDRCHTLHTPLLHILLAVI
ncbi:unnamed protein product, partial [Staurois parvus]